MALVLIGLSAFVCWLPVHRAKIYESQSRWQRTPEEQQRDLHSIEVSKYFNWCMGGMSGAAGVFLLVIALTRGIG